MNRYVEVIDKYGRTSDGGLVLDKECLAALRKVMCARGRPSMLPAEAKNLGVVIFEQLGLDFETWT